MRLPVLTTQGDTGAPAVTTDALQQEHDAPLGICDTSPASASTCDKPSGSDSRSQSRQAILTILEPSMYAKIRFKLLNRSSLVKVPMICLEPGRI